ncbi:hypothetical protein HDE_11698 [Halotydeus destructor]|nr:hypothetical protein HDE_11698 [Halotydeus destructor]
MTISYCNVFRCSQGLELSMKRATWAARKKQLVRIVALNIPNIVYRTLDPTECSLDGPFAAEFTLMPKEMGYNCTVVTDVLGERSDEGNYTGVIGQLQHDAADFAVATQSFPLAGDPIDHSVVIMEERLAFTTSYLRPSRPLGDSDILTSFLQFDLLSIVGVISLLSLFVFILKLKQQKNAIFIVSQYVLQYAGIQGLSTGLRLLGFIIVVGFFIVNSFYSNFIMAEIVREVHPSVLRHFSDIFKSDADLFVSEDFPRYRAFKTSSKKQLRLLAEKMEAQTLNRTLVRGGLSSYDIFYGQRKRLFGFLGTVGSQKYSRCLVCTLMQIHSADAITQSLWVPEDSQVLQMTTSAYNRKLCKNIQDVLNLALLHYFEHDLYGNIYYDRLMESLTSLIGNYEKPDPLCYSDVIFVTPVTL